MNFNRGVIVTVLITLFMVGCATYQPRPINKNDLATVLNKEHKCQLQHHANILDHPRIQPITLDFSKPFNRKQISVLAVLMNPDLKALRAKEGVSSAQVFDAGLLPDPQFSYNYLYSITKGFGIFNAFSTTLNFDVVALAIRPTKFRIAKLDACQTRYDVAWQEWLLANQAQLLVIKSCFCRHKLALIQKVKQNAKRILDVSEVLIKSPNADKDEFNIAQAVYLEMVDQVAGIKRDLQKITIQLNQILGISPSEALNIELGNLPVARNLKAENLFEVAQVYRLDILALEAGYLSQEAKLYQAVLGQFPHFNIGIERGKDNMSVNSVGPILSFDIPLFNRNLGNIAIQKATREQLYLEYLARLNQVRSDITSCVKDIHIVQEEQDILKKYLPELRKTEIESRKNFDAGKINYNAYTGIVTTLLLNELRLISLQQSIAEQMIALQIATGKYIQ